MANFDSIATEIAAVYKIKYAEKRKFQNLIGRTSSLLRRTKIKLGGMGGKSFNFPWLVASSGNVGGSFTKVAAAAANNPTFVQPAVTTGKMFSSFTMSIPEVQQSLTDEMAFASIGQAKMRAANEASKKGWGISAYSLGYGEIGTCTTTSGSATITVDDSVISKIDLGMPLLFGTTTSLIPASYQNGGTAVTVSTISGNTVVLSGVLDASVAGAYIYLDGSQTSGGKTNIPTGLGAWTPYLNDRAGADWTSYIGTSFYGVDRSDFVERMAGNFYARTGGETAAEAIIQGLRLARNGGAETAVMYVNPLDYKEVYDGLSTKLSYFGMANGDGKGNNFSFGPQGFRFAFATNSLYTILDDPFCPRGYAFIVDDTDEDMFAFYAMTSADKVKQGDPSAADAPGVASIESADDPETKMYSMLLDNWISAVPAETDDGDGIRVSLNIFGNFALLRPAGCCVVKL
jgi:hypothetical protein